MDSQASDSLCPTVRKVWKTCGQQKKALEKPSFFLAKIRQSPYTKRVVTQPIYKTCSLTTKY